MNLGYVQLNILNISLKVFGFNIFLILISEFNVLNDKKKNGIEIQLKSITSTPVNDVTHVTCF